MPSTTDPLFTRFSPRGGSDSNDSAAFSPGTSPPLILAFLAIGLFALSMVVMFGWRRIRYARVVLRGEAMPETEWTTEERNKALGPRPVLWDLQTIDEKGWYLHGRSPKNFDQTEEYETWYTIMPVSVVMTSQPGLNCGETVAPPPNRHRYWWSRRSGPACTNEKDDSRTNDNDNVERQLQVAVAIAMPSQRILNDTTGARTMIGTGRREDEEARRDNTFAYTLGVYECPWRPDMIMSGECMGMAERES